jgi:Raf kinase inhibitor-like YbhB/YbcL family protein
MALELTSTAFQQGQSIPKQYTGDGRNTPPPLSWTEPPTATQSFALICEDPDAPRGTFTHWIAFNLPVEQRELSEGGTLSGGALLGANDFGKVGYGGPAPPPGKPHRYFFKLYALDNAVDLPAGSKKEDLQAAMKGHILAEAQLVGTYGR